MVKKLVSVLCICAYFGLAHAQIPQEIWKESEQIEKQIKKTSSLIPQHYNLTLFISS